MTIATNANDSSSQTGESYSRSIPRDQEELRLCGCDLVKLPEDIFKNRSSLKVLDLSNNSLGRAEGEESLEWGSLKDLTALNVSANELKSWPKFLTCLSSVQVLSICGNELDSLPTTIKDFKKLNKFHADFNHLKTIPQDWSTLTNLTTLTLSNNRLEEIPHSLWSLPSLTKLDFRKNRISLVGISPLSSAKRLRELRLSNNRIRGCLDLSSFTKLEIVDVSHNAIQQMEVSTLDALLSLDCSFNNLKMLKVHAARLCSVKARSNALDAVFCNHAPSSLETLDISHNSLSELPCWILLCKNLKYLYADHNQITKVIDGLFCSTTNGLEVVQLNHNLLEKLPDSVSSCSVKRLQLQYNRLGALPENFFVKFSCLETLNLSYNHLHWLPPIAKCCQLKHVFLSGNQFSDVSSLESLFRQPMLKRLHLDNNGIKDIPDNFFNNCPSLENLSLACNQLRRISGHITKVKRLRKLYLHSNFLKSLPPLTQLSDLQVLDAACNDLNELELSSLVPKHLFYLDLSANKNMHIDPMEFQHLCSQRAVAVVDVNSAGVVARKTDTSGNGQQNKVPWCLGFTETEEGKTRLYTELQKDSTGGRHEALLALLEADNDFLVAQLRQALPAFLKVERECEETSPHYLRNVLLSSVRFVRARGHCRRLGITMCHLSSSISGGPVTVRLATLGQPSSCILGRAGNVIVLAQRDDNCPTDVEEWRQVMKSSDPSCTNQFDINSATFSPKGIWSSIPNPEVRELVLNPQDKFLVFANHDFSNTMPAEQVCRIVQSSKSSVAAAKALSEEYGSVTNGNRECVAVVTLQTPDIEEVEKYRCWEFMLEQNHKLLFTKELETIHKTILRDPVQQAVGRDPSSWYSSAFLKYRCPLPSHRGRYYCYGTKPD